MSAPSTMPRLLLRALTIWWLILACAFANGALRELVLIPALGSRAGLIISGLLLSSAVLALALLSVRWMGAADDRKALAAGMLWLVATLAFEFGFGIGVQHKALQAMLAAYSFADGNLWPVVLLVTLLAPFVACRVRGQESRQGR